MESALGEQRALQPYQLSSACDACHSRKVRCDRDYPCGNCQDQGTACTHHRRRRRLPKRPAHPTKRKAKVSHEDRNSSEAFFEACDSLQGPAAEELGDFGVGGVLCETNFNLPGQVLEQHVLWGSNMMNDFRSWMSVIPLTDAQLGNQRQLECLGGLAWTKQHAIESALYVARQALNRVEALENLLADGSNAGEICDDVPSVEFLAWIVKDVGSDRFGSYVLDYFKHISLSTLKRMELSLINNDASSSDSILFTVCVNAVACKFLTTVLMADDHGELSREIRTKAFRYRTSAQRALKNIRLLTAPSLALLQALLCGRSGDTQLCSELTRTACRVCVDLCLPDAVNRQQASEEEYYCVMWCYMLDRSYAWKLGRSRYFPDVNLEANKRDSLLNNIPVSDLLQVYMNLAQVQDSIIPFLGNLPSSHGEDFPSFYLLREQLIPQMEDIRSKIEQIALPSPKWRGLDVHSEVAALNFAYHSVMTTILHLSQVVPNQHPEAGKLYLQSARQELSALISMCRSNDNENTAAFLHW
ncbi:hypothetical protein Asppvi_009846 [Aspergillus pseudoviridinutans]|uniref:Zn(2)-C6 fungal-type domain-containing protein n=1 Tax=Aspergillus pseudoviridinutans TaxID=1517512 RepID=A0A9P3EWJ3_9EURO|nr:uncharacterized protein Asppvi_009846 [Aspergillus pseudoviridinutans]GIJ90881.1 hypothetical protein Asppvi_009846 [Aspergillus pseudoviridinutans]